jgi:acyl carrier protein
MEKQDIIKKILEILKEENLLSSHMGEFDIMDDLIDKAGFDSLKMVTFLTAIETNFNVEIPPDEFDFENFRTIETIGEFLSKKL